MKRVVAKALAALGLVAARRYDELSSRFREIMRERDDWKKRAVKASRRERTIERHAHELERRLKKLQRQARPMGDGDLTAMQTRPVAGGDLAAMQTRLAETERALALAREHLDAIEVKLEILEGAANVLDARTRVAPQHRPDKTGAAVS
jgi:hypothetical protein